MPVIARILLGAVLAAIGVLIGLGSRYSITPDPVTFAPVYTTHAPALGAVIVALLLAGAGIYLIVSAVRTPKSGTASVFALVPLWDHVTPARVALVFVVCVAVWIVWEVIIAKADEAGDAQEPVGEIVAPGAAPGTPGGPAAVTTSSDQAA